MFLASGCECSIPYIFVDFNTLNSKNTFTFIWLRIQHKVFVKLSECLLQPLSPQEILKAAKALAKDVCPRLDGLVVQWYILYWEFDR